MLFICTRPVLKTAEELIVPSVYGGHVVVEYTITVPVLIIFHFEANAREPAKFSQTLPAFIYMQNVFN